jgi:hypothetical protein
MKVMKRSSMVLVMLALLVIGIGAGAAFRRSYYGGWNYHGQRGYHYCHCYYKPYSSYASYRYHYCVYYPKRPSYVYYYNPYSGQYWGRYDLEAQGYSLLAEQDRKSTLASIPESAFPEPGDMPAIPESEDGEQLPKPPAPPAATP